MPTLTLAEQFERDPAAFWAGHSYPDRLSEWLVRQVLPRMAAEGLSTYAVAREAGLDRTHVSGILSGKLTGSMGAWNKILKATGVFT